MLLAPATDVIPDMVREHTIVAVHLLTERIRDVATTAPMVLVTEGHMMVGELITPVAKPIRLSLSRMETRCHQAISSKRMRIRKRSS
ncbi:MAG: hypothetical protein CMJ64_03815 [Planctomycetaceae bacterium]|nr:hypothetical protein [Planctomycetaceae bacterium]